METNNIDTSFKIKYDGLQHQIDAGVLINSLSQTTTIIQGINRHLDSGKRIQIKINALEKGSFIIDLDLIELMGGVAKGLFTQGNINLAASIITIYAGLHNLKKFLKGKAPKSHTKKGDNYEVVNNDGDVTIFSNQVFHIYANDESIKEAISRNFDTLNSDDSITGYEVLDKHNKSIFKADREEFDELSVISETEEGGDKLVTESATLFIIRPSFDPLLKWDFYYKRNKITAKIKDESFQKMIDNGEKFAKGDILEVDLTIRQEYDPGVKVYFNKSYTIGKIHAHKQRDLDQLIDFPLDSSEEI
jgi:hypothetical protein